MASLPSALSDLSETVADALPFVRTSKPRLARVMGAATAAYSVAVIAKPAVLAKPCGLAEADGSVPPHVAAAVRAVSTRDLIISVGMMVAPPGPALRAVSTVRGLCDISDGATLGLPAPAAQRTKILAVGGLWGSICLLAARRA